MKIALLTHLTGALSPSQDIFLAFASRVFCLSLSHLLLSSLTHRCPPVELLQGRHGVGARGCTSPASPCWKTAWALGSLSGGAKSTPTLRGAELLGCGSGAAVAALARGGAGRRGGGQVRGPGFSCHPPDSFQTCEPFPSLGENFQEDLLASNISLRRTLKKNLVALGKVLSEGGSTSTPGPQLAARWPQGCSSPKPSGRQLGRSAWAAGTFLSCEVWFLLLYQVNMTPLWFCTNFLMALAIY